MLTSLDIDTRSDIYALGVLLYEMLTGRTPFDAKELLAIGLDEMRRTIREREPPRPSTRLSTLPGNELSTTAQRRGLEAPKLVSELRGDLDWIVMKALEKDRARRYETANGLAMDIQRHLNNEPITARPPGRLYRLRKLVRRNRLVFAAGAAVSAALVIGLGASTRMFVREREANIVQERLRQQAQSEAKKARTEAAKSQQVAQLLQDMLKGVGPSAALGRDTTMLREILDQTAERVETELTNEPEVQIELLNTLGWTYWELGRLGQAEKMYRSSLVLMTNLWGDDNAGVAATLHNLAQVLRRHGDQEAQVDERRALAINKRLFGDESPVVAASLVELAHGLIGEHKLDEANGLLPQALSMNRRLFGDESPEVGLCLGRFGQMLEAKGELPEAEKMYRDAVRIQNEQVGKKSSQLAPNVELAWSLSHLSSVLDKEGKSSEAENALSNAVAVISKVVRKDHPDRLELLSQWFVLLLRHGHREQAEIGNREMLTAAENGDALSLNYLAWYLATRGASGFGYGQLAVDLAEKAVAATSRTNASYLDTLAAAYAAVGNFPKAVKVEREAIGLLHDGKTKSDCATRLKLYESDTPYLEP